MIPSDDAGQATELIKKIMPLLSGTDPEVSGMVIGSLVATWLVGHNPTIRGDAKEILDRMIDRLIARIEASPASPWRKETRQ